jgi:uncharacterized spore protein YtfJ
MIDSELPDTLSKLDMVKDVVTVKRVFGDAYEADGATVIPVAAVRGGGGGGGGEGRGPGEQGTGSGTGVGLGVQARPVGVYVVKDGGAVEWQPAVDVTRIVVGGQLVAVAFLLVVRSVLVHRRRR